jgi:hypothetical protein
MNDVSPIRKKVIYLGSKLLRQKLQYWKGSLGLAPRTVPLQGPEIYL